MKPWVATSGVLAAAGAIAGVATAGQSYSLKLHAPGKVIGGQVFTLKAAGGAIKKSELRVLYHRGTGKCAATASREENAGANAVIEAKKVGPGTFKVKQKYFFGYAGKYRFCGYLVPAKSSTGKPAARATQKIKVT